ncbi:MAG: short-chain dehydrogenase [Chloroflexi bacterium]|nr:MAG: short-chain dehydrogenase [Chloroflexota bacterium]
MAGRLEGRVAVITGGGSGIGAASARAFAAEGAQVVVADINADAAHAVANDLHIAGSVAIAVPTDVAEANQVQQLLAVAAERFGRLDVLFANAGIGLHGTVVELPLEHFDRLIAVNLRGPFLCAKYGVPLLAQSGGGSIIFTASELALVGSPENPVYCATKAGLIGMARAMALDHAAQGIRVNCICPGAVYTPMLAASFAVAPDPAEDEADIIRRMPLGRIGTAEEIAKAALFLASDDSAFMTGTALVVDGGWTAR